MRRLLATVATVAVLAGAAGSALAQDLPKLRAGQWDILIDRGPAAHGQPPVKSTMCTDDAVQREMLASGMGMSREICSRNDLRRDGARFVGTAQCRFGDSKMTSRSVMTLTGDSAYRVEIVATFDPPFMGMKDSRTTLDGKYVGPCRAGLVPGDIVGPAGQKFNVRNLGQGQAIPSPKGPPTATPSASAKKAAQ